MPRRGRLWVILILALGLFGLGYLIVQISTQKAGRAIVHVAGIAEAQEIFGGVPQEGDRLGSSDAPVTIQIFNDLQCSSCREDFLGTIPALTEDYARPGDVKLLYRHYSNSESPQELGFYGAEAAADQGYGWQYIYLFFRNQDEAERFGDRPGLPRLDRRRRRGTERPRMGGRPGRKRRLRRRDRQAARRLRGARPRPRHPLRPGGDRHRSQRDRDAPGRPEAGSDRTGHRRSAVIGAPGFEPGTSPTRTVRATRLRHAPRAAIISERRQNAVPPAAAGRYFARSLCSSKAMTRKISLILALGCWRALAPAAAQAYLPAGFIGVSPQSAANGPDFELMREAGVDSVRLPLNWARCRAPARPSPNRTGPASTTRSNSPPKPASG